MSKPKFSLIPHYSFRELTDITPEFLKRIGIKFFMLDLDNTIAAYNEHSPSDFVLNWCSEIRSNGIELFIVSNSSRESRVRSFSKVLETDFIMKANKPSPKGIKSAITAAGYSAKESAFAGDQVFTDALAANCAGVVSIVVHPIRLKNPFLAIRYVFEIPFRAMCRSGSV